MSVYAPDIKVTLCDRYHEFVNGDSSVFPAHMEISLCGLCNAACKTCLYAAYKNSDVIDYDVIVGVLKQLKKIGVKAISWIGGGEPTLHPMISEIIDTAGELGFKQGLFTNGSNKLMVNSPLDWVRVTKAFPIDKYGIDTLHTLKLATGLLSFCVNYDGSNVKDIYEAKELNESIGGCGVQVRPALRTRGQVTISTPPIDIEGITIADYKFKECWHPHQYESCYGHNFCPYIWEDGTVTVCGYMREGGYVLGNIYDDSIVDILSGMPREIKVSPKCQVCCRNHEMNKTLNAAVNATHREFA